MSDYQDVSNATERLFEERMNFIIIGLTGRTGSGCTTVANLLIKSHDDLQLPVPKQNCFQSSEERKYNIVFNYARKNWHEFKIIKIRDIITSFILEYDFNEFKKFVKEKFEGSLKNSNNLLDKFEDDIDFVFEFDELHKKRIEIKKRIENEDEKDNALKSDDIYEFYFEILPNYTIRFKEILNTYDANTYTEIYQSIGNNIRTSGSPYNEKFLVKNIFKLSERTNVLIKILRKRNLKLNGRVAVVIDAFRNPYEATFFKDRYSAFYLFSVNTEDKFRRDRLIKDGLNIYQVNKLDEKEYPGENKGSKKNEKIIDLFTSQNIQKCIELSDVFLYNPDEENNNPNELKKQIIKYISLIIHPGIITPTNIERCMQIAYNAKVNSGCLSRQVGAVVTDNSYAIKSIGWNDVPSGQVSCNLRNMLYLINGEDEASFSHYEKFNEDFTGYVKGIKKEKIKSLNMLKGRLLPYCFKDVYNGLRNAKNQVHTRSLHAEENAFLQIAKNGGVGLQNGYLFTTASPCELCSKKSYQIGIKKIYYVDPYPGISEDHILNNGNNKPEMLLFYGAIGRAYTEFYTPLLPYKDELYMLLDFKFKPKETEKESI